MAKKKKQNKVFHILTISLLLLVFIIPIAEGLTGDFYGKETLFLLLTLFLSLYIKHTHALKTFSFSKKNY